MYEIREKKSLNPTVSMMKIYAPRVAKNALPGQFIILRVDANGERIPLTIFDSDEETVSIIYQIVGATTTKLDALKVNDSLQDVVGPLGEATDLTNLKDAIVVGGGVGCAIAFPIVKRLYKMGVNVTAIVGFRNKDLVILEEEFKQSCHKFILLTDDGSYGNKGLVTNALQELLDQKSYDKVFAIGPLPMMKFVSLLTKQYNTKTIVSMNSIMVDGTGMCGGCRVKVGDENKFACVDGPDFDGHLVDFDETMKRNGIYKDIEKQKHEHVCQLLRGVTHE